MVRSVLLGALAAITLTVSPALADRKPTPEERARIESTLKAEGFTRWSEIEFDDGRVWEVDDAIAADGRKYDLKLSEAFAIVEREPD